MASGVIQGHEEFVMESGVVSVVVTCQRVVGPHGICYREWSGVVAIIATCQRVGMFDEAEWLSVSVI